MNRLEGSEMAKAAAPKTQDQLSATEAAIRQSQEYLFSIQYPDGYWWAELESNPSMEAEFIMLNHFLGTADEGRMRKVANYILRQQREDGTWGQFYEAPGDLSTTTECYFALKLTGTSPDEPNMRKAREFILSRGGVPATRVFTKIWLAIFGQWSWKGVPLMPPEIMLLPNWFPFNIYEFSSWARATVVPLLVVTDRKPVISIDESLHIDELYPVPRDQVDYAVVLPKRIIGWESFFYLADKLLRPLEGARWRPGRSRGVKLAEEWILEHQELGGDWGGIQPPWVYSLIALKLLGYSTDHPVMARGIAGFDLFSIEDDETLHVQACISPQWDTCLAITALVDSGIDPGHPAVVKAGEWLISKQELRGGDWQVKAKNVPPGGWAFEFHNVHYPDIDDTAEVVMALDRVKFPPGSGAREAIDRGVRWTVGMRSSNGGWASFDKDNDKVFVAKIPFSDFGESIDPPSVDVTAHVLEMLGRLGYKPDHRAVAGGLRFVLAEQEEDGAWFGRWGVNYIYGAAAALPALESLDMDMSAENVRRAVGWIVEHQNADGGWGESCSSYSDPAYRGVGPSTASQTSWALIALLSAGEGGHEAVTTGVDYLLRTQQDWGSWDEPYFTGAGFPGYGVGKRLDRYLKPGEQDYQGPLLSAGVMLNYHMYRDYWPLTALGRYRRYLREGVAFTPRSVAEVPVNL